MSSGRKLGYGVAVLGLLVVCGYTAFIMITQSARESATARLVTPDLVKRWEQRGTDIQEPITGSGATGEEQRYAAYAGLAKRMREIYNQNRDAFRSLRLTDISGEQIARLQEVLAANPELLEHIRGTLRFGGPMGPLQLPQRRSSSHGSLSGDFIFCALLLNAHARHCSKQGDMGAATESLILALSLGDSMAREPLPDSLTYSQRAYAWTLESLQTMIADNRIEPEVGALVLERLASAQHRDALRDALETEAYLTGRAYDDFDRLSTREFMQQYMEGDAGEVGTVAVVWVVQSPLGQPWTNINATATAEAARRLRELSDLPYWESLPEAVALIEEPAYYRYPADMFTRSQVRSLAEQAFHETRIELARAGVALEMYYAENGHYPDTIYDVARYLGGAVPNDPLSGNPFAYSTDGTSFELQSIGALRLGSALTSIMYFGDMSWQGQHKSAERSTISAVELPSME